MNRGIDENDILMKIFPIGSGRPCPSATIEDSESAFALSSTENYCRTDDRKQGKGKEAATITRREPLGSRLISHRRNSTKALGKVTGNSSGIKKVYCICREPERPGMIGCDYCDEWYHTQCLSLTKEEVKRLANEDWSCPNCDFKKGMLWVL